MRKAMGVRQGACAWFVAGMMAVVVTGAWGATTMEDPLAALRAPAAPLVTCDPYFSVWSFDDELTGGTTRHWGGREFPLVSLARVDGVAYRLMGTEPEGAAAMEQTAVRVYPTRTEYTFEGAGVRVVLTFLQAALPGDIDVMSRPVTYVTWDVASTDGTGHEVAVYLDVSMRLAVNEPGQEVEWAKEEAGELAVLRAGSVEQNVLGRKGDDVRIDWGYLYVAAQEGERLRCAIASGALCRGQFVATGKLSEAVDGQMPSRAENAPVLAMQWTLEPAAKSVERATAMLAYDDLYSVLYFGKELRAWWKRGGREMGDLLEESAWRQEEFEGRCRAFDAELMGDLERAGGLDYVAVGSLAYRQALGANKIVADPAGMPLMFSKECFSNGCMGTVDVFYPFAPEVLLLNPTLAKASFVPILEYARSDRWRFPFAPHDVGTYPHAMGQVYGGGERSEENQMPVEECGNMILLVAAVTAAEDDGAFARAYWDVLSEWAEYLKSKGLDPENQLCTDDFAGHLAHNVNLSVKAIVALGAYAQMAERLGEKETAGAYRQTAQRYVRQWMKMADDGDHYRLAFDKSGTWSQKYNLVWDRVLGLVLFPESVAQKEMAYYRRVQNPYGLPLDNRSEYTKLDWIVWTASITGDHGDFEALVGPVRRFLNETPDRVPMTDWYWTQNAKHRGFQARPVVGGVFIRLLDDAAVWKKWVKKADSVSGAWAELPKPPKIVEVMATSRDAGQVWEYTFERPGRGWMRGGFDAASAGWKRGPGGFGTRETPGAIVRTEWNGPDIWLRREFTLVAAPEDVVLLIHHDEDAEVYINGEEVARLRGWTTGYDPQRRNEAVRAALQEGVNTMAIHCRQTGGGQYIDAGLVRVIEQE